MVRVDFEPCWLFGPGVADGLEGGSPSQRLEVLGEVVGGDEGQHMGLEGLEVRIVEGFDGGFLDRAVHALGLSVGPRVVRLGEPVLDAVLAADALEDVAAAVAVGHAASVPGLLGEGHAVVGQHRVNPIRERRHDIAQEGGSIELRGRLEEGDVGELRDAVDG